MTRNEAKELLPIIQAFAEGKEIEYNEDGCNGEWGVLGDEVGFDSIPDYYRIKPSPKYRPFKTVEECWQEMLKHQPFGWIRLKSNNAYSNIEYVKYKDGTDNQPAVGHHTGILIEESMVSVFLHYTFADGTPFGMPEE